MFVTQIGRGDVSTGWDFSKWPSRMRSVWCIGWAPAAIVLASPRMRAVANRNFRSFCICRVSKAKGAALQPLTDQKSAGDRGVVVLLRRDVGRDVRLGAAFGRPVRRDVRLGVAFRRGLGESCGGGAGDQDARQHWRF